MAKQDGTMGEVIKWVLILGGGYLAYEYFIAPMLATTLATPTTGVTPAATTVTGTPVSSTNTTAITPVTVTPPTVTPPPSGHDSSGSLSALATKVYVAAGSPATLTADQWNYYWSQVSGVHQTADLFPTGNRTAQMNFGQYLAARAAQNLGVSGLGQFLRVGRNTLRTGGRRPMPTGYVRAGTPMRRTG